jgi:restriction system protein
MTVPTYDQFIEPILRFLAKNPDGASAKSVRDAAASSLGLTDEDRLQNAGERYTAGLQVSRWLVA